jgi:hypothetical protein
MTSTGTPHPFPRWWSARCPTCGIDAAYDAVCADCGTSFDIIDNGHHVSTTPKPDHNTTPEAARQPTSVNSRRHLGPRANRIELSG